MHKTSYQMTIFSSPRRRSTASVSTTSYGVSANHSHELRRALTRSTPPVELSVTKISSIEWADDPLAGLVLPDNRRDPLRCLVEAHNAKIVSEQKPRRCLVINLFGPPGVGKSQAAEAIAEHLKRPLYVISVGELGDHANSFETTLKRTFHIVTCWNSVLLIDEVRATDVSCSTSVDSERAGRRLSGTSFSSRRTAQRDDLDFVGAQSHPSHAKL